MSQDNPGQNRTSASDVGDYVFFIFFVTVWVLLFCTCCNHFRQRRAFRQQQQRQQEQLEQQEIIGLRELTLTMIREQQQQEEARLKKERCERLEKHLTVIDWDENLEKREDIKEEDSDEDEKKEDPGSFSPCQLGSDDCNCCLPSECSICLEGFENGQRVCQANNLTLCRHVYHQECIVSWLQNHDNCPVCRAPYLKYPQENGEDQV